MNESAIRKLNDMTQGFILKNFIDNSRTSMFRFAWSVSLDIISFDTAKLDQIISRDVSKFSDNIPFLPNIKQREAGNTVNIKAEK